MDSDTPEHEAEHDEHADTREVGPAFVAEEFAFVANGGDPDTVRSGNEAVLEGRLDDASFTFERDVALGIDRLAERVGAITFFAGAGTFADKAERLTEGAAPASPRHG